MPRYKSELCLPLQVELVEAKDACNGPKHPRQALVLRLRKLKAHDDDGCGYQHGHHERDKYPPRRHDFVARGHRLQSTRTSLPLTSPSLSVVACLTPPGLVQSVLRSFNFSIGSQCCRCGESVIGIRLGEQLQLPVSANFLVQHRGANQTSEPGSVQ